jgi:hypothetical protein
MKRVHLVVAALALAFPQGAYAEPPKVTPLAAATLSDATRSDATLSDDMLDAERGGEAIIVSNQALTAISEGSTINGDYSAGTISLSDNALSNFNGIGNLVINTGAQNNLQSGMNVTINIAN